MKSHLLRGIIIFSSLVLLCCLLCGFLPAENDFAVYDHTIRLHVLACSDSEHDQSIKLAVRDVVLAKMSTLLDGTETPAKAANIITENLEDIRLVCDEELEALGQTDRTTVIFSREDYPTRHYEGLRLPAGNYQSLRIKIGKAEGKNWWCMLYPALCTNVARTEASLIKTGFSKDQIEILTNEESPKYTLKFKFLELFGANRSE